MKKEKTSEDMKKNRYQLYVNVNKITRKIIINLCVWKSSGI